MTIKALAFDVFGTVVDWRASVARDARIFLGQLDRNDIDPFSFAQSWRDAFQPRMNECRSGARPYNKLETLIREALTETIERFGINDEAEKGQLSWLADAWCRLDPWPDVTEGLTQLQKRFPLIALSNGNVALTLKLARYGEYRWDAILGAEVCRTYKPLPAPYDQAVEMLGIRPEELCLVAAHEDDLAAGSARGLSTAYVNRPHEFGSDEVHEPHGRWCWNATDFVALARAIPDPSERW